MKANDHQVGGKHYQIGGVLQHWDVVTLTELTYLQGCATKYVLRHRNKNGIEDLRKAQHYIAKLQEMDVPAVWWAGLVGRPLSLRFKCWMNKGLVHTNHLYWIELMVDSNSSVEEISLIWNIICGRYNDATDTLSSMICGPDSSYACQDPEVHAARRGMGVKR
ncbi:DUF3310 domain-containing protein [bacterium]|nr:DUF3310 domain-containing protein [bacterium]